MLHSGPDGDDGGSQHPPQAVDHECGKCLQAECPCPGWYPDLDVIQMTAETIAARALFNQLADPPPFTLSPPVRKPRPVQLKLFGRVP